ncbi:MAG: type II toxin-antitoxin system RelE/ParE family toxin [Pseudomonadota bacterium]|nr:type II toxin-antitoxin system RelE/ParE family toxin [Pseudomonadota bacterium]
MRIVGIRHKGVARLYERNDASGIDSRMADKVRLQLGFLDAMTDSAELGRLPLWKPHRLSDGRWSFHVTANWRLTFAADDAAGEVSSVDLEDYH